jgi:gamma-polyglutamate biosynthesis protein CapA
LVLLLCLNACLAQPPASATKTPPAPIVTLALLGDVMLGRGVKPSPDSFAYLEPYLRSADLALANLESPLTTAKPGSASPYNLCAEPESVKHLARAGFDLLSLANNHRLDCGQAGLQETQATLVQAGLNFIGPDANPVIRTVNGLTMAFLAFDATADFDLGGAARAVMAAKNEADFVIISIHWGAEYQSGADSLQIQIAKRLAESGAALIWGHHPHVLQPAAQINSSLVLYSLGNALFDQTGLSSTRQSALALVGLDTQGVRLIRVIPFGIDVPRSRIVQPDQKDSNTILHYFR